MGSRSWRTLLLRRRKLLKTSIAFLVFIVIYLFLERQGSLVSVLDLSPLRWGGGHAWFSSQQMYQSDPEVMRQGRERMADRKRRVHKYCNVHDLNQNTTTDHLDTNVPFISLQSNFFFCPVTKSASTFWNRFILALNYSGTVQSPYKISLPHNAMLPKVPFSALGSPKNRARFLKSALKVVFVRNPYDRWFSTYVDKVFAPNPHYWHLLASNMAVRKQIPTNAKGEKRDCQNHFTFEQFISTALSRLRNRELHFIPVFRRCQPCQFRYDVIGKMETFTQDLKYISSYMKLPLTSYFSSDEFHYEYVQDAVRDSIYSPFQWMHTILRCISRLEMGQRIWRKLQIRGFIDRRIPLPYCSANFSHVQADDLVQAALKAHQQSSDKEELRRQKRDAFIEAYRSADLDEVNALAEHFRADFKLFGYDIELDMLNSHGPLNVTGAFDWLKPWGKTE